MSIVTAKGMRRYGSDAFRGPHALDMAFGDRFRLRRITAQVTDEPIITGQVQTYLPWLPEQRGSLVGLRSLGRIDNPITHRLNKASFIRRD